MVTVKSPSILQCFFQVVCNRQGKVETKAVGIAIPPSVTPVGTVFLAFKLVFGGGQFARLSLGDWLDEKNFQLRRGGLVFRCRDELGL